MKKNVLIIDGNYFSMRALGAVNMGDNVNNLSNDSECGAFTAALNSSFVNLVNTFNNQNFELIDNVIFVSDYKSWRKKVEPYVPYYIKDKRPVGYKEQRVSVKEESPINYDAFYELHNGFVDDLSKQNIPTLKIEGMEGDDLIMMLSSTSANTQDYNFWTFCTDGDMEQTVRDNFTLIRNIRSKVAPNGEFVISLNNYNNFFEPRAQTMEELYLNSGNKIDDIYLRTMYNITIGDIMGSNKVNRQLNSGISIAQPFKIVLQKTICGDKKDNIFSLFGWMSSTGTREYKCSEKMLLKAMDEHNIPFTDRNCFELIANKDKLAMLLASLQKITKQTTTVSLDDVLEHFTHNLKLILLSPKVLPSNLTETFNSDWLRIKTMLEEQPTINPDILRTKISTYNNSNSRDIFAESIPDILK